MAGGVLCEELESFAASSILNESIHERIVKLAVEGSGSDRGIDERNCLGEEFPVSHVRGQDDHSFSFFNRLQSEFDVVKRDMLAEFFRAEKWKANR